MKHLRAFHFLTSLTIFAFLFASLTGGVQTVRAAPPAPPVTNISIPGQIAVKNAASEAALFALPMAAPNQPTLVSPANGATNIPLTAALTVHVTDPDVNNLTVTFYGREKTTVSAPSFSIVAYPDTQNYTTMANGSNYFNAETQWTADNQSANNIVLATSLGDITLNGNNDTDDSEWIIADNAYSILERGPGSADDVPYAMMPGNHDYLGDSFSHYESHFGVARFTGRPYYGGHYGTDNTSNYSLFSTAGMHFILINLDCVSSSTVLSAALNWADSLLKADVSRRGIVSCHSMLDSGGTFSSTGTKIYNALKDNPNLFLMLAGHAGIVRRTDLGTDGHTINSLMADYEGFPNGGDGLLRIMQFHPDIDLIQVKTFSPTRPSNTAYLIDDANQFTLNYPMQSPDFTLLGTVTAASGTDASISWPGLSNGIEYEWYAAGNDGTSITISSTWSFTTGTTPTTCNALTLTHSGQGSDPVASPASSVGCSTGQYVAGESISLSGANPTTGWRVASWNGTSNDASTASTNSLTMPAAARTVTANYTQIEYTLSVTSAHGTVTKIPAQVSYHYNDVVQLSALADPGWQFASWTGDITSSANPASITITGNKSVTANYSQIEYSLTINISGGGTVSRDKQAPYYYNTIIRLTAVPSAGWSFAGWSGDLGGSTNPSDLTMNANKTVTATFTPPTCYALTLTHSGQGSNPAASPASSAGCSAGQYVAGEAISLNGANPTAGWRVASWSGTSNDASTASTNSLTMPSGARTVTVNYTQIEYTLSVTSAHGTVTKTPAQATYHYNDVVQLSAQADPGWQFVSWTGDKTGSANPTSITITGDKSVTATYTQIEYSLTINISGSGAVNRDVNPPYHYGDVVHLTPVPSTNWSFAGWSGDLDGITSPATITMNANKTVTATFTPPTCFALTLTHSGQGSNPTASPASSVGCSAGQYVAGESISLSGANPTAGWRLASWSGTSNDASTASTNSLSMPSGARTVTVNYTQIEYSLTINISGNGTVSRDKQAPYYYNTVVRLTAVASPGWSFAGWSGDLSGSTNPIDLTMNASKTVTANYTQNEYTLSVTSAHGTVTKTPAQATYHYNDVVQLSAQADPGWQFVSWTGDITSSANPTSITITGKLSVTANYTPPTCYALTLGHTGQGSDPIASPANSAGCAAGQYVAGEAISLSGANPTTGWRVASWNGTNNDASTASTNSITMPAGSWTILVVYKNVLYLPLILR